MSENSNTDEKNLAIRDYSEIEEIGLPVEKVLAQVQRVQEVMRAVMKENEHYGTIPGCKKPSLYKPGAEKLGFTFRLAPKFETIMRDLGGEHREYEVVCRLYTINGEKLVGEGVGSCSTREAKYRYRTGPKESTGLPVPADYWTLRKADPAKALTLIGGRGFSVAKSEEGAWEIVRQGEKMEHDNPADYYNTVLKMAKKRAHVDAILTATAASDIFTQDVEDGDVAVEDETPKATTTPTIKPPQPKSASPKQSHEAKNGNDHGFVEHDFVVTGMIQITGEPSGSKPGYVQIGGKRYNTFDAEVIEVAEILKGKQLESDVYVKNIPRKSDGKIFENAVLVEAHKAEPQSQGEPEQPELTSPM